MRRFGSPTQASPEAMFLDAGISQADIDFLNQERNAQLRAETLGKIENVFNRSKAARGLFRGLPVPVKHNILPDIEEAISTARGVSYFGDARQNLMSAPEIQSMIAQQQASTLQGVPTLGILPMMQAGFGQPQGGGLLNTLATQGMGQIASGQTMNPTLFKAKV